MNSQLDSMYVYDALECVTYRVPMSEVTHVGQGPFYKVCEAFFADVCSNSNCGYAHINIKLVERLKSHAREFHETLCGLWRGIDKEILVEVPPLSEPIVVGRKNLAFTRGAVQAFLSCRAGRVCSDHLCTWCPIGQMCQNIHVDKSWLKKMFETQRDLIVEAANNALVMEYSNSMVPRYAAKAELGAFPAVMELLSFPNLQLPAAVLWEIPSPTHAQAQAQAQAQAHAQAQAYVNIANTSPLPKFPLTTLPQMTPSSNGAEGANGGDCKESNVFEDRNEAIDYRCRIFASGKGIPSCTDSQLIALLKPYDTKIVSIERPGREGSDRDREFLYISMADEESYHAILEWPRGACSLNGNPLNFSKALPRGSASKMRSRDRPQDSAPTTHYPRRFRAENSHVDRPRGSFRNPNREGSGWWQSHATFNERFEGVQTNQQDSPNWNV